jgi:hypothetical protein
MKMNTFSNTYSYKHLSLKFVMIVNTNWKFSQTMQGKQITGDVEQAPSSKKLLRAKVGSLVAVLPFLRKQKNK